MYGKITGKLREFKMAELIRNLSFELLFNKGMGTIIKLLGEQVICCFLTDQNICCKIL